MNIRVFTVIHLLLLQNLLHINVIYVSFVYDSNQTSVDGSDIYIYMYIQLLTFVHICQMMCINFYIDRCMVTPAIYCLCIEQLSLLNYFIRIVGMYGNWQFSISYRVVAVVYRWQFLQLSYSFFYIEMRYRLCINSVSNNWLCMLMLQLFHSNIINITDHLYCDTITTSNISYNTELEHLAKRYDSTVYTGDIYCIF